MSTVKRSGPWSATEIDILKKAVGKYGIFRWNKVATLLSRSPEECRLRFYNLPEDWSEADDLRLVQLYRLFPAQYQTISLIMKKPVMQCCKRLEVLALGHEISIENEMKLESEVDITDKYLAEFANARLLNKKTRKNIKK
ncbi:hypothetical protein ENBRE01_1097 [Enteropsectra breve]|nr:hypothetical protein ENBRE01_1097 [Enteropsectra breve]